MTRRDFLLTGTAAGFVVAARGDDRGADCLADVTEPGVPARETFLLPPGAGGHARFHACCTGCQLCVTACPEKVLRPSAAPSRFMQPEMGFEHGYCRPECVRCSAVCPAGAILPVTRAEKRRIHIGRAVWHRETCLAAKEGVVCTACERHCPAKAIVLVPFEKGKKDSPRVPAVDASRCIGCGACENLCPARPLPAISLEGCEQHRTTPGGREDG